MNSRSAEPLYLIHAEVALPTTSACLIDDYKELWLSKLQAKVYHDFYGLRQVPVARSLSITSLIQQAITSLLRTTHIQPTFISHVIYAHTSLAQSPFATNIIRNLLLSEGIMHAEYFGLCLNKCASAIEALRLINPLLTSDLKKGRHNDQPMLRRPTKKIPGREFRYLLLVAGDIAFNKDQRILHNAGITGDASAVALFSTRQPRKACLQILATYKAVFAKYCHGGWMMQDEMLAFEKDFANNVANTIKTMLAKSNIELPQIRYILPHNINLPIWRQIAEKLNLDINKIFTDNIATHGHCFTADFLINYCSLKSRLRNNDIIVAVGVGFGLTIITAIFRYVYAKPCQQHH